MEVLAQERLLTGLDHARLSTLLFKPRFAASLPAGLAETARELLDASEVVDATAVDPDVVTMRSRVIIDRPGIGEINVCLVYPIEADPESGCISVLTPLGLSLLGARVHQVITWTGPDGREHRAKLLRMIYQPEAAGDYRI